MYNPAANNSSIYPSITVTQDSAAARLKLTFFTSKLVLQLRNGFVAKPEIRALRFIKNEFSSV